MIRNKRGQQSLANAIIWTLMFLLYLAGSPVTFGIARATSATTGGFAGVLIILLPIGVGLLFLIKAMRAWGGG